MTNILKAIYNCCKSSELVIDNNKGISRNRVQSMGEGLEDFIKNIFSGASPDLSKKEKLELYSSCFSFQGSKSRIPDLMIKNGDAIEVKKIESFNKDISLNSSFPKQYLFSDANYISDPCRSCEDWDKKDIIYTIGTVPKDSKLVKSIWFVYGSIFAANSDIYTGLKDSITEVISADPLIDAEATKEISRVNNVDPLKITYLRIRGMWGIEHPRKVFDYLEGYRKDFNFELVAIIPTDKYNRFPDADRNSIESYITAGFSIEDVKVQNPDNPVALIECKKITFYSISQS